MNNRKLFYSISSVAVVLSLLVFLFVPKNYGIDMTGGLQVEYAVDSMPTEEILSLIKEEIINTYLFEGKKVLSDVAIYPVNGNAVRADIGLNIESDKVKSKERTADARIQIPSFFKKNNVVVTESSFIAVWQSFGKFVLDRAYITLIMCAFGIALYVMFAFRKSIEWLSSFAFGGVTLLSLTHDILVASGVYMLLSLVFPFLKIDTFFVTAILTILGFSINDTIVILDRVRSEFHNRHISDNRSDKKVFEDSIQVSLWRSILTSTTLALVLIAMLFFWPEALYGFVTLMLLGTLVGTYSSIMIAAPLVYDIKMMQKK